MQFTQNTLYIVTEFIISLNGRDQINIHTYIILYYIYTYLYHTTFYKYTHVDNKSVLKK